MFLEGMTVRRLALLLSLLGLACGPEIRLSYPLTSKRYDSRLALPIGLHISDAARSYVTKGHINVVGYQVDFGDSFEANAAHAFGAVFDGVKVLDRFPPAGPDAPRLALDLDIADADVSPGALTFMASHARVELRAKLAVDGAVQEPPIDVTGNGEGAPGALGAAPIVNQNAYDSALQKACESAMGDALQKLVDASITRMALVAP